jgi:hypothetical protein
LVACTDPFHHPRNAPLAVIDDSLLVFSFPAIRAKKITAAFDGGRLTSDGGVMLLAKAKRRLGVAYRLLLAGERTRYRGRALVMMASHWRG